MCKAGRTLIFFVVLMASVLVVGYFSIAKDKMVLTAHQTRGGRRKSSSFHMARASRSLSLNLSTIAVASA
jgi:hypothetical protein